MLLPLDTTNSEFITNLKNGEIIIDNSSFMQLDSCPAQGIMGAVLKKQPTASSIHLDFGSCVHAGLEEKYRGGSLRDQIRAAQDDDGWEKIPDADHFAKTQDKVKEILRDYDVHTKIMPDFELLSLGDEKLVEQGFRLKLGTFQLSGETLTVLDGVPRIGTNTIPETITVYWQGKIDLFVSYQGMPWLADHKTTSVMGAKFAETFLRSSQMIGYYWAAQALVEEGMHVLTDASGREYDLRKTPIRGVIINAVAIRKSGLEFKIFPIPIPLTRIEEWRQGTLLRLKFFVEQMAHHMQTNLVAPTRDHCVGKYGRCPFFDVCESPDHMRKAMLESSAFLTSDWSPLK